MRAAFPAGLSRHTNCPILKATARPPLGGTKWWSLSPGLVRGVRRATGPLRAGAIGEMTMAANSTALAVPDIHIGALIELIEREHVEARKELEGSRWDAHIALHLAAGGVADKAATDVKEALDKAAAEVTQRLTDVRSYIDAALASHSDLHEADRTALNLARATIDGRLADMNELRTQINNERGKYVDTDRLDARMNALKAELLLAITNASAEARAALTTYQTTVEQQLTNGTDERRRMVDRIGVLENAISNMNGRFYAFGAATLAGVGVLEFILRNSKIGA